MKAQNCPICLAKVAFSARYANYICSICSQKAVNENNLALSFSNDSLSGGFIAFYTATKEKRASHICYIEKIKCRADEAHFGGIVIQLYDQEN